MKFTGGPKGGVERLWQPRPDKTHVYSTKNFLLAAALALLGVFFYSKPSHDSHTTLSLLLSRQDIAYGHKQCARNAQRPHIDYGLATTRLHARHVGPKTIISNATLIDGDGVITKYVNIEIVDNIFVAITKTDDLVYSEEDVIINVNGRYVTPGLIDMHSHAGVREEPQLWATEDVTELSAPVTPWGRAVDAIKPHDAAIQVINSGGITTSLVLTGAKNSISGEGAVIKMKKTDSIPELLMNLTESDPNGKPQRYLKMAMGENQKRQFQNSATGPTTRIGESYWFRHAYDMASQIKHAQDRWCELAATKEGQAALTETYPRSLEWQTLVDVLRGDLRVNVHGYETEDIFAMFDHADEYGFNITALHHALHSDLIAKEIKQRNITIVAFSDSWGDKKELYNVSSYMLKTVAEYEVPVVLTRDHPALHGQWLAFEAQIAHHFGLPANLTIASIIAEPARTLGLDNRIGFVRPGYDADLVVWDRYPLQLFEMDILCATDILDDNAIVSDQAALHFSIGHDAKQLLTTQKAIHPIYGRASSGSVPVVVHTSNRDTIGSLIHLKRTTLNATNLIVMGGAEAHFVAHGLASADIPVILAPWSCEPLFWESRQCLPGPPLTDQLGAQVLMDAGVKVALSSWEDTNNHVRNAIWEAAWIAGPANESLALDLVSSNLEEMLGLPKMTDFVVFEGSPFQFGASPALIFEGGSARRCWPGPDE
ncbi:hypothetical protein N0V83_010347 [Neocucurbitaria cava]|uniref:Amidohydrolase-related domain-containing protein n=1 Tax=Neocucurbitaria cava TaxID=798079 RepID=A0A9W8XXE5_9PLEO|nr:hypothetical protein N0V83_010347 [Neocucurbitaria cava]